MQSPSSNKVKTHKKTALRTFPVIEDYVNTLSFQGKKNKQTYIKAY